MKVIVLAAGYATRLYPLTKERPKPLLTLGQKPILNHIFQKLVDLSISEVVIITNNKFYSQFEDWRMQHKFPFDVQVINDGSNDDSDKLGAIGDILYSLDQMQLSKDEGLMILAGDNIFEINLNEVIQFGEGKDVVLAAYQLKNTELASQYGVLKINQDQKIIDFKEKPEIPESNLISTGIYYFPHDAVDIFQQYRLEGQNFDAPGYFIQWCVQKKSSFAYQFDGHWYDIGDLDSYQRANEIFLCQNS